MAGVVHEFDGFLTDTREHEGRLCVVLLGRTPVVPEGHPVVELLDGRRKIILLYSCFPVTIEAIMESFVEEGYASAPLLCQLLLLEFSLLKLLFL